VLTANALGLFAIALCADGIIPLLARSFYAFQDTWTPVRWGIGAVVLNLILALVLKRYGVEGIALAFALTQIAQGVLLIVSLQRKIKDLFDFSFAEGIIKIVAAAAGGAVMLQVLKAPVASVVDMETGFGVLMQGLGAGMGGVVVYYALARYFKCPGVPLLSDLKGFFSKRSKE
jgi:putative peptidoglycan lipid II flippase